MLRILVVDDYDDARELFAEFLELSGYQVLLARDGMEALEVAQREVPDVILMDLSLPVMDGWEASLRLKEDPRTHAVPIIALSGLTLDCNSEAVRKSGCDAFLRKPVGFVEVEAKIREVLLGGEAGLRAAASV
ncbi:MAG: response regulator [Myxococcota bacterium]|nr:response regulator [Myxococcota bacterium]